MLAADPHLRSYASLVDPGRLRTAMHAQAYPGEDPKTLPLPEAIVEVFVQLAEASCQKHNERIVTRSYLGLRPRRKGLENATPPALIFR